MKKTILMVIALCCSTMMIAQKSYRELLAEYSTSCNSSYARDKIVGSLVETAKLSGVSAEEAKTKAEKYYDEEFYPTLVTMMEEGFKGKVSEDDLKQIMAAYKSPAGQTALANTIKASDSKNQEKIGKLLTPALQSLLMGGSAQKIAAPAGCPESYQKKCSQYCKLANATQSINSVFEQIKGALSQVPNGEAIISKLATFFEENGEGLIMNTLYPEVTEADLDFYNKTMSTTAGKHIAEASLEVAPKVADYAIKSITAFTGSLKK